MGATRVNGPDHRLAMRLCIGVATLLLAVTPLVGRAQAAPEPVVDATPPVADAPPSPAAPETAGLSLKAILTPTGVFAQYGGADHVNTFWAGAFWDFWQHRFSTGRLTASVEAGFGEWQTYGERHHSHPFTQIGLTPTLRFYPEAWHGYWFVEAGIGANIIAPAYHTDGKRFSTQFNFGDHLGVGREFGHGHRQEIVLRFEHFSNAGIDHPNPGENFVQVRWALRF